MYMCKEGEGRGEDKFIRMVNAAPYPMMLIAMDYTLVHFSILGVDPTFNLCEFDVTVTSYRLLLLEPYGTPFGKPPTMIGPMLIHDQKDFGAYHSFTSTLVGQRRDAVSPSSIRYRWGASVGKCLILYFPSCSACEVFLVFLRQSAKEASGTWFTICCCHGDSEGCDGFSWSASTWSC